MAKSTARSSVSSRRSVPFSQKFRTVASVLAISGLVGCAPPQEAVESVSQPGLSLNGLSFHGLAFNGLSFNGLSFNGLSFNGLSFNGLSFNGAGSADFANWFNCADGGDVAMHGMTMKYLIRCAISSERTASFTDSK